MNACCRIFALSELQPKADDLTANLRKTAAGATGRFESNEKGWSKAEFHASDGAALLSIRHYWHKDEGIRQELQTWAAWLETREENSATHLMQHMISTQQVFVLETESAGDNRAAADRICMELCRFLATATDGVYQIDGQGFFATDGTLLVRED